MAQSVGLVVLGLLLLAVGGCGGSVSTASLGLPAVAELPSLPKLPALPASHGHAETSPTETYAQVARGATTCWFGAGGQLKQSHVFHADAEPPSSGGKAEIALHERDASAQALRGAKVYRIALSSDGSGTQIEHTNHKLPDPLAAAIQSDVHRFARGNFTCATDGPTAPKAEPAAEPPATAKGKANTRPRPAARNG